MIGGSYADYVARQGQAAPPRFVAEAASLAASPRRKKKPAPVDTLTRLLGMLPSPDSFGKTMPDEEIRAKAKADAMGILGPLLDRENADYAAQTERGTAAVKGFTDFFTGRLGAIPGQVASIYDRQKGITAGLGDALSTAQGEQNQGGIDSLSAALSAMKAPHAGDTIDTQSALSAGGTRLTRTLSAVDLQKLANEGASQESFAALMPGIGVLQGGQTLRDYLSQIADLHAAGISDINAQAPSLAESLFSRYYGANQDVAANRANAQSEKAKLAASWLGNQADLEQNAAIFGVKTAQEKAQFAATLKLKIAAENNKAALAQQKLDQQAAALDEKIAHNRAIEANANASLEERRRAAKMREAQEKARRSIANRKQVEAHRHNAAVEKIRKSGGGTIVINAPAPKLP